MKRISLLMFALMLMGGVMMAQGSRRGGDKAVDPKVRAEQMTDRMVKEYSLTDEQKAQLYEANLQMVSKMGNGRSSERMRADKKEQKGDSVSTKKDRKDQPKMSKEDREKMFKNMKESREAYDTQLKKILTKEQYDAYTKKQAERRQNGKRQ